MKARNTTFHFAEAHAFMLLGDMVRRRHWSKRESIQYMAIEGGNVIANHTTRHPYVLTDEDKADNEWIVYRQG